MGQVLEAKELLEMNRTKWGSDVAVCNKTGLNRVTLWRIDQGRFRFRPITIAKLLKGLNV